MSLAHQYVRLNQEARLYLNQAATVNIDRVPYYARVVGTDGGGLFVIVSGLPCIRGGRRDKSWWFRNSWLKSVSDIWSVFPSMDAPP